MTTRYGSSAFGVGRGEMRAADVDRDRAAELLNTAYVEGRLSKDEYDARLDGALSARTFGELDRLVSDLPAVVARAEPPPVPTATSTNGLAIASLACGLAQFAFGPLATIPAIVFGHVARRQIRRSGEQGAGLALAGLLLGWAAVVVAIVGVIALVAFTSAHPFPPGGPPPPPLGPGG